jgi:4-hydroxybenzoate polyprenyl transferase
MLSKVAKYSMQYKSLHFSCSRFSAQEEVKGYYRTDGAKDIRIDPYYPPGWVTKYLPLSAQPYFRLLRFDQNFSKGLLITPVLWGVALASPLGSIPNLVYTALTFLGVFFVQPCSCSIDDIVDAPVDAKVERSKRRPLACGAISKNSAYALNALMLAGVGGVMACMSPLTIKLCMVAAPMVFLYPYMKRFFQYPQYFLSIAVNLGSLIGLASFTNAISLPVALPLFLGGICWTIYYDSLYAYQDIKDDLAAGIFSSAQKFTKSPKLIFSTLAASTVLLHTLTGVMAGLHPAYFGGMACGASFLTWQILKFDPNNPAMCDKIMLKVYWYGMIVWLSLMLGVYLAKPAKKPHNELKDAKTENIA